MRALPEHFHSDATHAIREANGWASDTGYPCGIAYRSGKGWTAFDLRTGIPHACMVDWIAFGLGTIPLALNCHAIEAWHSILKHRTTTFKRSEAHNA